MWEQSRWKSFKPSLIYLQPPLLTIDYGFYLPPLIEIERRSQVGMIPEVSIDFVFNKGQKKNLVWRCLFFGIIHLDKDIYQDYEGRMRYKKRMPSLHKRGCNA